MGLEKRNGKLSTRLPIEEAVKGLKKIISDIANRLIVVNNIYRTSDRQKYIDNLDQTDKPDLSKSSDYWDLDSPIPAIKSAAASARKCKPK